MTLLSFLGLQRRPKWITIHDPFDYGGLPTKAGWYRVMIKGDSETEGPHVYYAYDDYETWAYFRAPDPTDYLDEVGQFTGIHDEETDMVFAWCGPFDIPARER